MITTAGRTNAQAVGFSPKTRWANVLRGAVGSALISSVAHGPGTWSSCVRRVDRLAAAPRSGRPRRRAPRRPPCPSPGRSAGTRGSSPGCGRGRCSRCTCRAPGGSSRSPRSPSASWTSLVSGRLPASLIQRSCCSGSLNQSMNSSAACDALVAVVEDRPGVGPGDRRVLVAERRHRARRRSRPWRRRTRAACTARRRSSPSCRWRRAAACARCRRWCRCRPSRRRPPGRRR